MRNYLIYLCFILAFSFGSSKVDSYVASSFSVSIEQIKPADDSQNTVDRRKRAHKRKRQIRPRRNGF